MTKYLAFDDPVACVRWAFDFIHPYLNDGGEHGNVVTRSILFLRGVLDDPMEAGLNEMEIFVWEPWNHRSSTCGGGPLARLIWAAMGVVEYARPGQAARLTDAYMFPSEKNHLEIAGRLVWQQSATAIQMIANDHSDVPQAAAVAFTKRVCFLERPPNCNVESRVEWLWNGIVYEIATVRTPEAFYFEFTDRTTDEILFSGPFASVEDADKQMELLGHQPKTIRIVPVKHNER